MVIFYVEISFCYVGSTFPLYRVLKGDSLPTFYEIDMYTLSRPKDDRDVTVRVQEYTLEDGILYVSIPVFLFERVREHTSCARDNKRLPPAYAP